MTRTIAVYLEVAPKKTFACAVDWPGWSRSGRTEDDALAALAASGARYARVAKRAGLDLSPPNDATGLAVSERLKGGSGTEFGVPSATHHADETPMTGPDLERQRDLLEAAWAHFDATARKAIGVELRKGPRGGGRDLDKIMGHVLEGEAAYVTQLGGRPRMRANEGSAAAMRRVRGRALEVLEARVLDSPIEDPSGTKKVWTPRYFVRRSAWHTLDHAWEIEDRMLVGGP